MFDLSSITNGSGMKAPRIILLGVEKIGKSTFAAAAEAPVFLPIIGEEGIDDINVQQTPTCRTFEEVERWLNTIYSAGTGNGTVVIDSVSALEPLVHKVVCQTHNDAASIDVVLGGYGKGYTLALDVWRRLTTWLDAFRRDQNMASILIGHVKVKRFDDPAGPSYDQYQFDINDRAANLLYRWADVILFANTKVVVKTEQAGFGKEIGKGIDIAAGSRFLYTQKRPAHPGGGRGAYGRLPYELPLSWPHFMDSVASASAAPAAS